MGALANIITELKTIAVGDENEFNGFESINSFTFETISAVNWEDRNKKYPLLLVDHDYTRTHTGETNPNNYIPKKSIYTIKLFFLDSFHVSEQKEKASYTKLDELEALSDQYLAELQRRAFTGKNTTFELIEKNTITGFGSPKIHNDNLAMVTIEVKFRANNDCDLGTFNYAP